MRRLCIAAFLLLFSLVAQTQYRKEYLFTNYSTSNGGLATNLVNSMAQDDKGYMWIATYNGLQRFDGIRFLTFRTQPGNSATIPHNHIQVLYFDKKNRLWLAGNNNTIGFFNTTHFRFKETHAQSRKAEKTYITKQFLETPDGQLLVYEEKGDIYRFDDKAGRFVVAKDFIKLPAGWKQNRITWDSFTHKYWIACDSGLVLFNPVSKQISYRGQNTEQDPVIKQFSNERDITNVFVNTNNTVSFYTRSYLLYYYNRITGYSSIEQPGKKLGLNFYEIHSLFHQRNGRIWVHGVKLFAQWLPDEALYLPVSSFYNAENKIKSNYVNFIFEDRESNLWVATDNGLFLFNPDRQLFDSYRLLHPFAKNKEEEDVLPMSVIQTKDEQLFIGTWKAGLFLFDKYLNSITLPSSLQTLKKDITVWSILEHQSTGKVWLAVEDGGKSGLIVYDPKSETLKQVNHPVFERSVIRKIEEDGDGNLWFGTQGGHIVKWEQGTGDVSNGFVLIAKLPATIRKLYKDRQGFIWITTHRGGLLKANPKQNRVVKDFTEDAPAGYQLKGNDISDVLQYNDSTLIVSADAHLNFIHLKTQKVSHISTADGLPANTIVSVQKDQQGIIWLGLLGGICRVNLEKKTFTTYDRKDGIPYDNFLVGKALQLQSGRLLYTTSENLLVIDPSMVVQSVRPSPPQITSFHLANKRLPLDSLLRNDVQLNYDNSSISIGFSNLSFLKQKKLQYYYKLEGLDKDWVQADATKQAQYNYIQPGTYTFYVKSVNEDGASSSETATLRIAVKPPFWKTGVFYAILTLLGILILFLIDKERIKRLKAVQQMRSQIAGDLHNDIHSTLNDINVLSVMAKIKVDKDLDRSKDYIDSISLKSRDMMESMDDILWSLNSENDSMEKMLLRIREYTDSIRNSHETVIELNTSNTIKDQLLDMRSRHEFLLFYKHALAFIIHKAHRPTIHILLEYVKGKLTLRFYVQSDHIEKKHLQAHLSEEELYKRADTLYAQLHIEEEKKQMCVLLELKA